MTIPSPDDFMDLTPDQTRKRLVIDSLAGLVQSRFMQAATEKAGITEVIEKVRRVMRMEPVTGTYADEEVKVCYPIAPPIADGIAALITNALQVSEAAESFVLKPTPIADLPEEANQQILEHLRQMQQQMAELGVGMGFEDMAEAAKNLEGAARAEQQEEAKEQANSLLLKIKDQLTEAGFTDVLAQAVRDFVTMPAVCIKAPAQKLAMVRKWENGRLTFSQQLVRGVECLDIGFLFPAPGAFGVQQEHGDFVCELRRMTTTMLAELSVSPDYDSDEIMRLLAIRPTGFRQMYAGLPGHLNTGLNGSALSDISPLTASGDYDAIVHWGRVQGRLLEEFGVAVPDPLRTYEAEIVVVDKCVIRAALNPDSSGRRPYHVTSFWPTPKSVWGTSPVMRMFDMQRAATSMFTSLIADAALAGVHLELDPTLLHSSDKVSPTSVRPRQVRIVKNTGTGNRARAYDIFQVQAQTAAFSAEIERLHAACYELCGVSRLSLGSSSGSGTVGRTAQGVAALLNQQSMPIRMATLNIEAHLIEPCVQSFVDWELQWAQPGAYSGDVNVMARGLSSLLEQQGDIQELQQALQALTGLADKVNPETGKTVVSPDAIPMLLSAIFEKQGISTEGLFDKNYTLSARLRGTTADQATSQVGGFQQSNMGRDAAMAAAATPPAPAQAPAAPTQAGPPQ
jgi:hypothetical protein